MAKAFIIDDDIFSVEVIYKMIPWKTLDITQVEKIYSPTGAADRILSENPDVVFIDIEMGDVSGIDIIKSCKNMNSKALFVVVSGHNNFEYAQAAINLGAVYYILKPIDTDDISTLTKKLKKELSQERNIKTTDFPSSKEDFNTFMRGFLGQENYRFFISSFRDDQIDDFLLLAKDILFKKFKIGTQKYLFIVESNNITADLVKKLSLFAKSNETVLAISNSFDKTQDMHDCFIKTNQLSYHYFISQSGCLLLTQPDSFDVSVLNEIFSDISNSIDARNLDKCEKLLKYLPEFFILKNCTMTHVMWFYNTLVGKIKIAYGNNKAFPFLHLNEEEIFNHFGTFSNLCDDIITTIKEMITPRPSSDSNSKELWKRISQYIEDNYSRKMQVSDICSAFFISTKTLYNVSKENTNKSYLEYLTYFRIEKAKQFLKTTPLSIPEIAEKVGIKDHYYFIRLFKKYTGVTPSKFKNEEGEG